MRVGMFSGDLERRAFNRCGAARFLLTKLRIDRNTENIRGPRSVGAAFGLLASIEEHTTDGTAARPSN